jgi:hypothetical protein
MLHSSIKKYRIVLEYNLITNSIDVEPYKPIKCLREKAIRLFFPIKGEMKLTYNNKDLTPHETVTIGEYFKNKNNIIIKVIEVSSIKLNVSAIKPESEVIECSCNKSPIKNYCRSCNEFICDNCKLNVKYI